MRIALIWMWMLCCCGIIAAQNRYEAGMQAGAGFMTVNVDTSYYRMSVEYGNTFCGGFNVAKVWREKYRLESGVWAAHRMFRYIPFAAEFTTREWAVQFPLQFLVSTRWSDSQFRFSGGAGFLWNTSLRQHHSIRDTVSGETQESSNLLLTRNSGSALITARLEKKAGRLMFTFGVQYARGITRRFRDIQYDLPGYTGTAPFDRRKIYVHSAAVVAGFWW